MKKLKVVIIGAGSGYTPELVQGFIQRFEKMPIHELWLVDIFEGREKLDIITAFSKSLVSSSENQFTIKSTLDRTEALQDADFVVTQFRIGQLEARIKDENIPLQYNVIGQETNGPGALLKAFRTIPVMLDLVEEMEKMCPEAWLINFANPAGILSEAISRYSNWEKIISICNGPLLIEKQIAEALQVERDKIFIDFMGLNHLIFAKSICLDGKDVTSYIVEKVAEGTVSIDQPGTGRWDRDFLLGLGVLPMSYLQYYWKTSDVLSKEKMDADRRGSRAVVATIMEGELFDKYKMSYDNKIPSELKKRGGEGYSDSACELIYSLYSDRRDIQTVNVKNNGAIPNLDDEDIVEVNCVITNKGPIPLTVGKLPYEINGIIQSMKSFEKAVCEAAVTGSYQKAVLAMTINPLVSNDKKAKLLLNEMLLANKKYLPQFDLSELKK